MTRRLAHQEGLLVGISSGANLVGALKLIRVGRTYRSNPAVLVVIFCDGGERYLSERFWEDPPKEPSFAGPTDAVIALSLEVDAAIRAHGARPFRTSAAARCSDGKVSRGSLRAAEHDRGRTAPAFSRSAGRLSRAEKRAREQGLDLLGFYHSHPDHPAVPSQYDLDHAWPSFSTSSSR